MAAAPAADFKVLIVDENGAPVFKVVVIGNEVVDLAGITDGQVLTVQPDGTLAFEDPINPDAMRFKGVINASGNPNYPAATAGDVYRVSVAGKIGGASGTTVEVSDLIIALADNAGGTQAAVGASWSVEQGNITIDTDGTLAANSDALVPSQKAVKTYADTKVAKALFDANTILAATTDDTPAALAVGASTLVGRAAAGGIAALTAAQAALLVNATAFIRKTATESVTSSIALQNDDELLFALEASATYVFDAWIKFDAATTGDLAIAFTVPAGAVIDWNAIGPVTGAANSGGNYGGLTEIATSGSPTNTIGGIGVNAPAAVRCRGIVVNGATPGNLQLQWAQGTSDITPTRVFLNSFLMVQRVA